MIDEKINSLAFSFRLLNNSSAQVLNQQRERHEYCEFGAITT